MRQALAGVPTVLDGIDAGTSYTLQNRWNRKIYVQESDSAPPQSGDNAFLLPSQEYITVQKASDTEIYIWTESGNHDGFVVYEAAA